MPPAVVAAPQLPIAAKRDREPTGTGAPPVKKRLLKIKASSALKAKPAAPAVLGPPPSTRVPTPTALLPPAPAQPANFHSQQTPAPLRKKIQIKRPLSGAKLPTAHVPAFGGGAVGQATGVEPLKKKIKLKLAKPAKPAMALDKKFMAGAPLAVPSPMGTAAAAVQPPLLTPQKSPLKLKLKTSTKKLKIKSPSKLGANLNPAPIPAMKPPVLPLPQMGVKVKRKPKLEPKMPQTAQVLYRFMSEYDMPGLSLRSLHC